MWQPKLSKNLKTATFGVRPYSVSKIKEEGRAFSGIAKTARRAGNIIKNIYLWKETIEKIG